MEDMEYSVFIYWITAFSSPCKAVIDGEAAAWLKNSSHFSEIADKSTFR